MPETGTTTTTQVGSAINAFWISPAFSAYARERVIASQFAREYDLRGKGTATAKQPRIDSVMEVGDHGASLSDFKGLAQGAALALTQLSLEDETVTSGEYGVAFGVTYNAIEDVIADVSLVLEILRYAAGIVMTAFEDDTYGALSGFDETVGEGTGGPMDIETADEAIATLVHSGVLAPAGSFVACVHNDQGEELYQALKATGTNQAVYSTTADRLMGAQASADNGSQSGLKVVYRNVPFYVSGLADTADSGDSLVGAMFVRGDVPAFEEWAGLGKTLSRDVTMEMDRVILRRRNDVVTTTRMGVDVVADDFGVVINTKAPGT
jgi:hypothetical protein